MESRRIRKELEDLLLAAPRLEALEFRGLMTVPPFTEDPEGARPCFRKLRELRDVIAARKLPSISMRRTFDGHVARFRSRD